MINAGASVEIPREESGRRNSTLPKDSPVVALSQPAKPEVKANPGSSPTQTGSSI